MPTYVFCVASTTVTLGQMPVHLHADKAYASDDDVVRRYPHLFSDTPRVYDHLNNEVTPAGYGAVEQATAAPGERRGRGRG